MTGALRAVSPLVMNAVLPHADVEVLTPLLRVSGLTARGGPGGGLSDVDLTVGRGELVALAGEPGAGKTTLVRCVAGDADRRLARY